MTALETSLEKALKQLRSALDEETNDLVRDAAIQRFEFTVELAWKAIQQWLRGEGIVCNSPKECLKAAFTAGLVKDDERGLTMMEDRNLTSHTYNEKTAEDIFSRLSGYLEPLEGLVQTLKA